MALIYDAAVIYDTPDYTYDGDALVQAPPGIKTVLYRELVNVLDGFVAEDHIHLDMRLHPEPAGIAPWVVFTRITTTQSNAVPSVRERWEFEIIVPRRDETTLETIRQQLIDRFAGAHKTFGMVEDGQAVTGLRLKAHHISTIEDFQRTPQEKSSLLIFAFSHLR